MTEKINDWSYHRRVYQEAYRAFFGTNFFYSFPLETWCNSFFRNHLHNDFLIPLAIRVQAEIKIIDLSLNYSSYPVGSVILSSDRALFDFFDFPCEFPIYPNDTQHSIPSHNSHSSSNENGHE